MARVLVLNQYYSPDTAATGTHAASIAEQLASCDHHVCAVVGQPSYAAGAEDVSSQELRNGVHVTRVSMGGVRGRERLATRVIGYLRYLWGAGTRAFAVRPDVIVSFHTPPPLPLVALAVARWSRAKVIYVPQDIHPDILLATGFLRLPVSVRSGWDSLNRFVLRRVAVVVALGQGMRDTLVEKGAPSSRVEVIPLWAEPELEPTDRDDEVRRQLGVGRGLMVLYAGNLGVMHPLEPVLQSALRLANDDVTFVFAGGGVHRKRWRQRAEELNLRNVQFIDFQHGEAYARLVAAADVTLVTLEHGMERLAVPSRSFGFLSAGKPIIAEMAAEADVARIITAAGAGWQTSGADSMTALIVDLLSNPERVARAGTQAREVFEHEFRRSVVTTRYSDLVDRFARE